MKAQVRCLYNCVAQFPTKLFEISENWQLLNTAGILAVGNFRMPIVHSLYKHINSCYQQLLDHSFLKKTADNCMFINFNNAYIISLKLQPSTFSNQSLQYDNVRIIRLRILLPTGDIHLPVVWL